MIPQVTMAHSVARAWRPGLADGEGSDELIAFYAAVIPALGPGQWWAEVGVNYGRSLLYAAEQLVRLGAGSLIFGIDPWQGQSHPDPDARSKCSFAAAVQALARWSRPDELEIVYLQRTTSVAASKGIDACQLVGVVIDGDHRYEAVQADIQAWRPKVKPGGILAGHDYSDAFPGVRQAVDEAFPDGVELRGTMWAIEVPAEPAAAPAAPTVASPSASRHGGTRGRLR
jgi:Methyltransferase domain